SRLLSTERACARCGAGFPELDPRFFSSNTRQGQCAKCEGLGFIRPKGRRRSKAAPKTCPECEGRRLSPLARAVIFGGRSIDALMQESVSGARAALEAVALEGRA